MVNVILTTGDIMRKLATPVTEEGGREINEH